MDGGRIREKKYVVLKISGIRVDVPWVTAGHAYTRDFTNQNATQFENTDTEKGQGRERRHERGKNKVTGANSTTEAELCKSFKLR